MFDMIQNKNKDKKFLNDLENHYGARLNKLPEKMRNDLEEFLNKEKMTDGEKTFLPPPLAENERITKDTIKVGANYDEIRRRCKIMKFLLNEVDLEEKAESFTLYSEQKKGADQILTQKDPSIITEVFRN